MSYGKVDAALAEKLEEIVGKDRFQYGSGVGEDYSHDEMPIYGKHCPEAVCLVESTEEVSGIMSLCYEHEVPVTVRLAAAASTKLPVSSPFSLSSVVISYPSDLM